LEAQPISGRGSLPLVKVAIEEIRAVPMFEGTGGSNYELMYLLDKYALETTQSLLLEE